jgi:transposase-like protein
MCREKKMSGKRTRRTKEFKFKVALEAIEGEMQIAEIAAKYSVHPNQVTEWKKQLLEKGAEVFSTAGEKKDERGQLDKAERLYKTIGHQAVRIDWLKKKLGILE